MTDWKIQRADRVEITYGFGGFPEREKGPSAELFLEDWVSSVLHSHRALVPSPRPGACQEQIIMRLFNYLDRDVILLSTHTPGPLLFEGHPISIYPDYTQKVQDQRKTLSSVKKHLRDLNLKYSLMFPTELRVQDDGKAFFFFTAADAAEWIDSRGCGSTQVRTQMASPRQCARALRPVPGVVKVNGGVKRL
ncbi:hypothetical protein NDU88_002622 [Pleurodeles waltl]|uniref:Uncharacterized protein n=1 Tax=Pleurodeles waltl TaxID=8319 RepID=A0AAV7VZV9_PLEWA|nr:hypothetical protein NDU88_002622 [Pleurodeles waltl]